MRGRIVMSAFIVLTMSGAALAQDEAGLDCVNQLAETESLVDQTVNALVLDEGDVEEVNMLLDEADAACTDGNFDKAKATMAKVKGMLKPVPAPAEEPAADQEPAQ